MDTQAQPWDFIETPFITDWDGKHFNLLQLVRHIRNSNLALRLFGSTSMDKLIVSIYNPIDYSKEALHIKFNLQTKEWHFEYKELPFQAPKFTRTYKEEEGIEKFDNFIKLVCW